MNEFLQVFGEVTIGQIFTLIIAILFIGKGGQIILRNMEHHFDEHMKDDVEKNKIIQQIHDTTSQRIPEIERQLAKITDTQADMLKRLDAIEADNVRRALQGMREQMMTLYRYYTSDQRNPTHKWTEMEAGVFNEVYTDYINMGGDGQFKERIRPAMDKLEIVPMSDKEALAVLMASRQ